MFGVVPKAIWNELVPADADNLTRWPMRCLLVDTGTRRVLIDTGIGGKQDDRFRQRFRIERRAPVEQLVEEKGTAAADVTDVVLTHLHFDHCGGAVTRRDGRLAPAFPNASYWVTESQWEAATRPNPRERASYLPDNFVPLRDAGQLRFFTAESWDISEIGCGLSDGHTAGQIVPRVHCGGRDVIFMGGLIPSVHHVRLPYIMAYDLQPLVIMREKEALLREAAEKRHVLFFEHDPLHECCTVCEGEKAIEVERTFALGELDW